MVDDPQDAVLRAGREYLERRRRERQFNEEQQRRIREIEARERQAKSVPVVHVESPEERFAGNYVSWLRSNRISPPKHVGWLRRPAWPIGTAKIVTAWSNSWYNDGYNANPGPSPIAIEDAVVYVTRRLDLYSLGRTTRWKVYSKKLSMENIASAVGGYLAEIGKLDLWQRTGPRV